MQALVLAAGYGTRMGSLSQNKPKHLLEIKEGIPVIELLVRNLASSRYIEGIFVITNEKFYAQFEDWVLAVYKEKRIQKPVILINNKTSSNEERLGSVGDILYGLNEIRKVTRVEELFVAQGDDLNQDLSVNNLIGSYYRRKAATIVVHRGRVEHLAERFGVIEIDENSRIIITKEKPRLQDITTTDGTALANNGIYIFTKEDLKNIERYKKETIGDRKEPLDKTGKLFAWMTEQGIQMFSYEHAGRWWDVGKLEDLESARKFYQNI